MCGCSASIKLRRTRRHKIRFVPEPNSVLQLRFVSGTRSSPSNYKPFSAMEHRTSTVPHEKFENTLLGFRLTILNRFGVGHDKLDAGDA
jgi:hypothetical protein